MGGSQVSIEREAVPCTCEGLELECPRHPSSAPEVPDEFRTRLAELSAELERRKGPTMSTSERDELAVTGFYGHGAITLTAYPSSRRIRVETRADNSVMDWSDLFEFVDEIRKATVTTAEELDALPVGSVVLDRNGNPWKNYESSLDNRLVKFWEFGDGASTAVDLIHYFGPLTVLHEGGRDE
jgi:hypothetical protein